jgi:cytochrome c556
MKKVTGTLLFVILAGALAVTGQAQPRTNVLKDLMHSKVKNSQALLEGLALADYGRIRRSAEELIRLSNTAEWVIIKTPQYDLHSNEFRRAAEVIVAKAKAKNLDGVALAYGDLTRSCVRCHEYVREVREARLPGFRPPPVMLTIREH